MIVVCLAVAAVAVGRPDILPFVGWGALTLPGWLLLIRAYGLYDRDPKRINCSTIDDIPGLFHSLFIGSVLLWGYYRLLPVHIFGIVELLIFASACSLGLFGGRVLVRNRMRAQGLRRAVIVGQSVEADLLARKLEAHPEYGVQLIGALRPSATSAKNGGSHDEGVGVRRLPRIGTLDEVDRLADEHDVDRVIVTSSGIKETDLIELLRSCRRSGLRVSVLPQIFDVIGPSVEIDEVEGLTLLGLNPPILSRSSRAVKRAMDLVGSLLCLIAAAPLFVIIAVAIKLDSPGPVFFAQRRVGRAGRRLRVYKFRTMVNDAEAQREQLVRHSSDPNWLKLDSDPRITRVGKLLRLTSLDELPQLFNVLRGEMSLVGPRPLIESESQQVVDWGRARLDLTPGITGLWQVLGRTSIPFEEMVKLDYLYVTNWSLWNDVRLLMHTLPAVFKRRGAN